MTNDSKSPAKFLRAILCEETRAEINRKNTLLGVFSGHIAVQKFPAKIRLAVYAEVEILEVGSHKFVVTVSYSGEEKVRADGKMSANKEGLSGFTVPSFILPVEKAGEIVVAVKFENADSVEILQRNVDIGDIPSLAAAPS